MATRTPEEREAYFAYVKYVQSVAELRESKAKARNAKEKKEAMIQKYIETVRDTLKQAKKLTSRAAYVKELNAHAGDLENMHQNGNIEYVAASMDEQNKKVAEAGHVAINTVEPVDKDTLYSQMVAQPVQRHEQSLDNAWMKIIPALHRGLQDLKRIEELKREIAEDCDNLEFLKSVQPLLRGDASDSQYSSAQELESCGASSSEDISEISR